MNKEELLKAIMELPKVETNNPISAMNTINVDDLMSAVDRLNKVPTYDELLKENKQLKERIEYLERSNNRREDTILEQRQEISDLEDNWNKLKEFLVEKQKQGLSVISADYVLYIMIEIERGESDK